MLTAIFSYGQKYALIKMSSIEPIKFADLITNKDIRDQRFPIETESLDSVIIVLHAIKNRFEEARQATPSPMYEYKIGILTFQGSSTRMAYGVRMAVTMTTEVDGKHFGNYLCKSSSSNNDNIKKIERLIDLLSKEK